jgi:hypothetical protein
MADDDEWTRDVEADAVGMMREFSKSAQERVEALLRRAAEMREAVRELRIREMRERMRSWEAYRRAHAAVQVLRHGEYTMETDADLMAPHPPPDPD